MSNALELLKTRRSVPAPALVQPGPDETQLHEILTIAARVPDHGKLVPWRFILLQDAAVPAFSEKLAGFVLQDDQNAPEEQLRKERGRFCAPAVIVVVSRAGAHPKIPVWEQELSAGAVCMNLENAATALGFGTVWVTGWAAYDARVAALLGLAPDEKIAGFIQLGTPSIKPEDRPRPNLADIVTRWDGAA
jgi:nitroreductase